MLTPQEVAQRSFTKASFGGYNMAMVDDFLDEVTADYESLFNENALLKQKLGVLSGKIREYQSTEEAMRKTLLAAQEMSDKLVKETEAKCAQMLAEAESRSATRQTELAQDLSGEERKLQTAKAAVEEYKNKVRTICQQQLEVLDQLDQLAPPELPQAARSVDSAAEDIQAAVERSVAQEEEDLRAAQTAGEAPAQDAAPAAEAAPAKDEAEEPAQPPVQPVATPAPAVEESSVSLYEQLMAQRRAAQTASGGGDATAPTRRAERKTLEFGRDFEID